MSTQFFTHRRVLTIIIFILLLSAVPRVFRLGSIPSILNRDEAALAYNALLLHQVGVDEWNQPNPLVLQSFGDYKLPGYVWALKSLFMVFPAQDWVVKLPSVVAGLLIILLTYGYTKWQKLSVIDRLIAMIFVGSAPVFIFYSRIAFEAHLGLALFLSMGLLLGTTVENKNLARVRDMVAIILALLAGLTYNTPLLLMPLVLPTLILVRGVNKPKQWLFPVFGLSVVILGLLTSFAPLTAQKQAITIFSDETVWQQSVDYRQQFSGVWQSIFGNKYIFWLQLIAKRLVSSFSVSFLVTSGGAHPWHSLPMAGHVFYVVYAFGWVGTVLFASRVFKAIQKRQNFIQKPETAWLVWLLASLAPAVITVDAPHATRSLLFFWIWIMLAVEGWHWLRPIIIYWSAQFLTKPVARWCCWVVFWLFMVVESSIFLYRYFLVYPSQQPLSLQKGFDTIIQEAERSFPNEPVAVVDSEGFQYILLAWYLKIPPQEYLDTTIRQLPNAIGFRYGQQVTNYHFIGQADDRSPEERILIEWTGQNWELYQY